MEKDFWIYLRKRSLDDFHLDDIALLEHATDDTVIAATKELGIDSTQIVRPQSYRPERRISII
jgi:hypothetical protein